MDVKRSSLDVKRCSLDVRETRWALDVAQNVIGRSVDRNQLLRESSRNYNDVDCPDVESTNY